MYVLYNTDILLLIACFFACCIRPLSYKISDLTSQYFKITNGQKYKSFVRHERQNVNPEHFLAYYIYTNDDYLFPERFASMLLIK